jgi:hypothetical protein
MNDNEYDWDDILFEHDVEGAVKQSLQYLLDEGVIVKIGDKYRLKTKKEIKKELNDILNHNE